MLLLDGKLQSAESDEGLYHEVLVHPALLHHPNPKNVFIMGGGEGSTAREVLRHKAVEKCTMVDIDQGMLVGHVPQISYSNSLLNSSASAVVVDFCKKYLDVNKDAFEDSRLDIVIDDARTRVEGASEGQYDVIIGDLADPVWGNPCYQLYTKAFYEVLKTKLAPGGIFVTQSGPCGLHTHTEVFSTIHNTLRQVRCTALFFSVLPAFQEPLVVVVEMPAFFQSDRCFPRSSECPRTFPLLQTSGGGSSHSWKT